MVGPPGIDAPQKSLTGGPGQHRSGLHPLPEDGEVVIGAELLTEVVGRALDGVEDAGPDLAQQAELVTKVLHLLAPLVECLGTAAVLGFGHGLPAGPGHALQTLVETAPPVVPERPPPHPGRHPLVLPRRPEGGLILRLAALEHPVLPGSTAQAE